MDMKVSRSTSHVSHYTRKGNNNYWVELCPLMSPSELDNMKERETGNVTLLSIIKTCGDRQDLQKGMLFHHYVINTLTMANIFIENTLVAMYTKCGYIEDARQLFDRVQDRNVASWTAIIAGYAKSGYSKEAIMLHCQMELEGIKSNEVTYVSLLQACMQLSALKQGMQTHVQILHLGLQKVLEVSNSLVSMYSKCGSMKEAFLSLLTACSHSGLIEMGYHTLYSMEEEYYTTAAEEHYACMVDLLGRAGCLREVELLLKCIPVCPSLNLWRALLGALLSVFDTISGKKMLQCLLY